MKKVISLIAALALLVTLLPLGTVIHAASQEVTLSAGGSLADALAEVADGGTIRVDGTVAVTAAPGTHGKTVTVTGGELDFSSLSSVTLGDHITFDDITLTFTEETHLYANGYKVKMGSGVTMTNAIKIFGGKNGGTVASTNLTLLAGTYLSIYGGSHKGSVTGDAYLYVGGSVNSGIDAFSHSHTYCVYGGNYSTDGTNYIMGTACTVFTGSAKANYVYGGNYDGGAIYGGTDLTVSGGFLMSVYGANRNGSYTGDVKLLISGGTMEQVFGGSEGGAVTGDVKLDVTGGTIKRRVYGGCYNNYTSSGWSSTYYVTGDIVLTLHSGANIDFSYSDSDRAIYAHSRQKTLSSTEVSHLVYADSTAYSNYKDKVKAQDWMMQFIMGSTSAADHIHYHTYTASGNVITQSCSTGGCSANATATLVVDEAVYTGSAVKPAKVIYDGTWFGGDLVIAYSNNVNPGTGTAAITCGGVTVSQDFTITRDAKLYVNGTGYASLDAAIAAAKQTDGADTIIIHEDVTVSSWLVLNTDVTIIANEAVTITAADTQTGGMVRVTGGTLTIAGASEDAKITLAAGKNTQNIITNTGGNLVLTNVCLEGNEKTVYTANNKTYGIFNRLGTVTAKSVEIKNILKGDGIYAMDGTTVNLDNVTVSNIGRYGIKVKGTVNISNTVRGDHALSVSGCGDHAIDIENGGKLTSDLSGVSADTYPIQIFDNARKGLHVRGGGSVELSGVSVTGAGEHGIYFARNGGIGASGKISDFRVSGAGKEGVYLAAHSVATLTNGTVADDGCCVKTEANSTLSVSDVTVQTGGNTAAVIRGTLEGELKEAA